MSRVAGNRRLLAKRRVGYPNPIYYDRTMTLKDLAKTALGNLTRHKVRTVLSAVGVTVGILTLVTMVSLGVGVHRETIRTFESAGLEQVRVYPATEERDTLDPFAWRKRTVIITPDLVEEMRARNDVVEVRPREFTPWGANISLQIDGKALKVRVGDFHWGLSDPFSVQPEILAGRELSPDVAGEMVVSAKALRELGYEDDAFDSLIGQKAALVLKEPRGEMKEFPFQVVGVLETVYGAEAGYFGTHVSLEDMTAINAWWYNDPDILQHEGYDELVVRAASLKDAAEIVDVLQERGFEVQSLDTVVDIMNKAMIVLETMLGSIGGLALFVAAIGIANTMVMAVYERTREIGILKAVGASPGDIRRLFVAEASLIGLVGGVVGTVLGWLLGLGLNAAFLAYLRWQEMPMEGTFFVVTGWLVALALTFATVVGLLAGLYPAARAARLDPLEALRYE
jgi:putative ABC transport system permease protein